MTSTTANESGTKTSVVIHDNKNDTVMKHMSANYDRYNYTS